MGRRPHQEDVRGPPGMEKIGYDSDERITFWRDEDGVVYKTKPGNTYGEVNPLDSGSGSGSLSRAATVQNQYNQETDNYQRDQETDNDERDQATDNEQREQEQRSQGKPSRLRRALTKLVETVKKA